MKWLFGTLRGKLLLGAMLPALVMVVLIEWAFLKHYMDDQERLFEEYGQAIAHQFGPAVDYAQFSGSREPLYILANGVLQGNPLVMSVSVLDRGGSLLAQSGRAQRRKFDLGSESRVFTERLHTTVVVPVMAGSLPLEDDQSGWGGGEPQALPMLTGHVVVELSRAQLDERRSEMLQISLLIVLAGMALSGWLSFRIAADVMAKLDAAAEESHRQREAAERLARTDALTGLANRRAIDEVLGREVQRAQRYGTSLTLILTDLDYFKSINDTYGHHVGDQVLASFARVLGDSVREVDMAGRWGGEEFIVLMPGIGLVEALQAAERMRLAVAAEPFRAAGVTFGYTASFGVATLDLAQPTLDALLGRADAALYRAKNNGRNRVEAG
jgi:diguanylate cyclase (GGDEF)-like protein